ncbi:hypothetical protein LEN26_008131 [Aphanomyces euteiches]|nr:hypothetical protein AeMF1_000631 [Aphanomyces euteiches]KAH9130839.1 hypothetical protein LEN26_008131 [Aphanomyces euteiches]KAH9187007.1 hypothetical protein AeNC1_011017 [Aphanomyces euteiches]
MVQLELASMVSTAPPSGSLQISWPSVLIPAMRRIVMLAAVMWALASAQWESQYNQIVDDDKETVTKWTRLAYYTKLMAHQAIQEKKKLSGGLARFDPQAYIRASMEAAAAKLNKKIASVEEWLMDFVESINAFDDFDF